MCEYFILSTNQTKLRHWRPYRIRAPRGAPSLSPVPRADSAPVDSETRMTRLIWVFFFLYSFLSFTFENDSQQRYNDIRRGYDAGIRGILRVCCATRKRTFLDSVLADSGIKVALKTAGQNFRKQKKKTKSKPKSKSFTRTRPMFST